MLNKVHHITFVVESIDDMANYIERNFSLSPLSRDEFEDRGFKSILYRIGEAYVDFFEPLRDDTPMAQQLKATGPGVMHVAFGVDGIDQVFADLVAKGNKMRSDAPAKPLRIPQSQHRHRQPHGILFQLPRAKPPTSVLTIAELRSISAARLEDAQVLFDAGRYDACSYLCGYSLELALKARICETLNWVEFPESGKDFENYRSFKTHNLNVLLFLSGIRNQILADQKQEWETVMGWNSELWYARSGRCTETAAAGILHSTQKILRALWSQ